MRTVSVPTLFDRWFQDFEGAVEGTSPSGSFTPPVDMLEHADHYEIVADLPGVEQEKVDVAFNEGTLTIRGARAVPEASEGRVLRSERRHGEFARSVVFREEVDVEHIEARFKDGVLRVTVPKIERPRPRQIPIAVH